MQRRFAVASPLVRRFSSALVGVAFLGAFVAPSATLASGTAPVPSNFTVLTNEDTPASGNILDHVTDAEHDTLTVTDMVGSSHGIFAWNSNGTYTYTPDANWNGSSSLTYEVYDGTPGNRRTATITLSVTAVNDVPSFTKGADKTVVEDSGAQTFAGWATSISKGPSDESGQVLTFHVSATDTSLFSSQPAVSTAGTLTFTPAADANGTTNVDVYLTDNGGTVGCSGACDTTATQTFSITITSVNDVPSFTKGANKTVNEDSGAQTFAGWATGISAGATNESGQVLTFHVSATDTSLFSSQPAVSAAGTLTFTPAANANGTTSVDVYLTDDGGTTGCAGACDTTATQTFSITVDAVNDLSLIHI